MQSYMSLIVTPGKYLTLTILSLFNILLSSMPENIESPTMRVVFPEADLRLLQHPRWSAL